MNPEEKIDIEVEEQKDCERADIMIDKIKEKRIDYYKIEPLMYNDDQAKYGATKHYKIFGFRGAEKIFVGLTTFDKISKFINDEKMIDNELVFVCIEALEKHREDICAMHAVTDNDPKYTTVAASLEKKLEKIDRAIKQLKGI